MQNVKNNTVLTLLISFILLCTAGFAGSNDPDASELIGTWLIDLRPSPNAAPYVQEMTITSVENGRLQGTFYGSTMQHGRLNTAWGRVIFAFVTEDGSGVYNTTGELRDGKLVGTTHAIGRDFISPWTGEK